MTDNTSSEPDRAIRGPLKRFAQVRSGYAFRAGVRDDPYGDTRVLQLRDVDEHGRIVVDTLPRVMFGERAARHVLDENDVLLAGRGGKSMAFAVPPDVPLVASAGLLIIRPNAALEPAYLCWFLNHPNTQRRLQALREGSNLQFIDKTGLESLHMSVPDVDTQRRIAELDADHKRLAALRLEMNRVEQQLLDAATWQMAVPDSPRSTDHATRQTLAP